MLNLSNLDNHNQLLQMNDKITNLKKKKTFYKSKLINSQ